MRVVDHSLTEWHDRWTQYALEALQLISEKKHLQNQCTCQVLWKRLYLLSDGLSAPFLKDPPHHLSLHWEQLRELQRLYILVQELLLQTLSSRLVQFVWWSEIHLWWYKTSIVKSWAWKLTSALLMVRKGMSSTISGLTSANRRFSSKNLSLLFLSDTKKVETTIP